MKDAYILETDNEGYYIVPACFVNFALQKASRRLVAKGYGVFDACRRLVVLGRCSLACHRRRRYRRFPKMRPCWLLETV